MKHKILYFLPLLLCLGGCFKNNAAVPPLVVPSGTFTGEFRLLHRSSVNVPFDTTKAEIVLTLNTPAYTYAVTGDTSTVHAGSKGVWGMNNSYINFADNTYPKSGTPTKTHLNGLYLYYYNGSVFQMIATSADTLALQYDLKKTQ
ncbi:MAG: hypothetical protein JST19_07930 [Bacteroidetes bacterium]|nr:hypothetical protein [Bacteroidota bacterium]